jgi:prepilin-type N-terminal cleavage/methylation domain-containing protein
VDVSSSSNRGEGGFTLVEVMVCSLILTIGMLAIAGLLAVTTQMHVAAREAARSTRLAQDKLDALMRLDFDTADEIAVGGSLDDDDPNHFDPDAPDGISVRWLVETHPDGIADLRVLTVHVQNRRAQTFGRDVELTTIIRNW